MISTAVRHHFSEKVDLSIGEQMPLTVEHCQRPVAGLQMVQNVQRSLKHPCTRPHSLLPMKSGSGSRNMRKMDFKTSPRYIRS